MMSTTITIPTDLEERIAARAGSRGQNVEEFALETLAKATEIPSLRELFADVQQQVAESGLSEEEIDKKIESAVSEVRRQRRA